MRRPYLVVIPARLASTRLFHKPCAPLAGQPLIVRVWRKALATGLGPVIVATDSARIAKLIRSLGGQAVLTSLNLTSGSDRVWQAVQAFDPEGTFSHILNLQGDLPVFPSDILYQALSQPMDHDITTLAAPLASHEVDDPNVVKVAVEGESDDHSDIGAAKTAIGFKRTLTSDDRTRTWWHHIGLYVFKRPALAMFVRRSPSFEEKKERLEQLRATKAKLSIGAITVPPSTWLSVDTPTDLAAAEKWLLEQQKDGREKA
jgi:3-deoxy-manno-octulosonate cytidylyltransferase (CMP-KDO synthetase)